MKKSNNKKGLKAVVAVLIAIPVALITVFAALMYIIPVFETVKKESAAGSADWRSRLPDDNLLSETVIPGTHDSASKYADLAFFSKCQALTVAEQLEAGYRYLDIRLAVDGDDMNLMHGFTACRTGWLPFSPKLKLSALLDDCYRFLDAHPTETIIFAVKQEHGDETVAEFQRVLNLIIGKNKNYWITGGGIPTVGEARGKLVLLRRYPDEAGLGADSGTGLYWRDQGGRDDVTLNTEDNECDGFTLHVQDRYKYDSDEKWNAFLAGIAKSQSSAEDVSLNFLSTNGSPSYGHPYKYARDLNSRLLNEKPELKGWIAVDFADAKMAELIYSAN